MRYQITQLALDLLAIILPALAAIAVAWLYKRLGVEGATKIKEQLEAKQALAVTAVLFVQQVYQELEGPSKYDQAAMWLSTQAEKYGLDISDAEIKGLIESALKALKAEFAEQWA